MPASTKKQEEDAIIEDELVIERAPAITPDPTGFYSDADWIRVECDWPKLQPRDGFGKLWAEIDASLTFHEALAIPLEAGVPMMDLFNQIVNRVRAWNMREFDAITNTMVPVPPPSEIGKAALMRVKPIVIEWLAFEIRQTSLFGGPNRKNEMTLSDPGSDGPNAGG